MLADHLSKAQRPGGPADRAEEYAEADGLDREKCRRVQHGADPESGRECELMFQVKRISDGKIFTVYGVTVSRFLIWDEKNGHWSWPEQDQFMPLEVDE